MAKSITDRRLQELLDASGKYADEFGLLQIPAEELAELIREIQKRRENQRAADLRSVRDMWCDE